RAAVPDAAITTDVIAGFPGETPSDFEATLALCREVGFARVHAFPYSRRQRTAAATMEDQVPEPVRKERMARLLELGAELARAHRERYRGSVRPVLWEEQRDSGCWSGLTDNYIRAYTRGTALFNRTTPVRLEHDEADGVWAVPAGGIA